ncbi:MAG TPA: hypothetical protein P5513_06720 [Candidatus Diapherotrites archaeon]|nr:hypothetical protein [Candidatus Diapherotrites archaeon]
MEIIIIQPKNNIEYYKKKNYRIRTITKECDCKNEYGCEKCDYTGMLKLELIPFSMVIDKDSFEVIFELLEIDTRLSESNQNEIIPHILLNKLNNLTIDCFVKFNNEKYGNNLLLEPVQNILKNLRQICLEAERREDNIQWFL